MINEMVCLIPIYNQASYINEIVEGFESQQIKPKIIFFILDRCNDNSLSIIKSIKSNISIDYVEKSFGRNFSAGDVRNYGFSVYTKRYNVPNNVLFLDGDCIPNDKVVKEHLENLNRIDAPIISCGRRKRYNKEGINIGDQRDTLFNNKLSDIIPNTIFHEKNGKLCHSSLYHDKNVVSHSCNLAMNKEAIELCCNVNNKLYNNNNTQIFNNRFDGIWGYEDNFIGQLLFSTNGYIFSSSKYSYVEHKYHQSRSQFFHLRKNFRVFKMLSSKIKTLIKNNVINTTSIIETQRSDDDKSKYNYTKNHLLYNNCANIKKLNFIKHDPIYDSLVNHFYNNINTKNKDKLLTYLKMFFVRNNYEFDDELKECKFHNDREFDNQIKKLLESFITIKDGIISYE